MTATKLGKRMANVVFALVRVDPAPYIGISGSVQLADWSLLYVEGFDPRADLREQLLAMEGNLRRLSSAEDSEQQNFHHKHSIAEAMARMEGCHRMFTEITVMLQGGAIPEEVRRFINENQKWPCFALISSEAELAQELSARFRLGRCELDYGGVCMTDAVLLLCRMIPREWRH